MKHSDYLDTLRGLSREEIAEAFSAAQHKASEPETGDDGSKSARKKERTKAAVAEIEIQQPGGTTARFLIRLTEISKSGLGFLHGGYLHAGSRCRVTVMTQKGGRVTIPGVVQHGRCIRGRIHCFDVQFGVAEDPDGGTHS